MWHEGLTNSGQKATHMATDHFTITGHGYNDKQDDFVVPGPGTDMKLRAVVRAVYHRLWKFLQPGSRCYHIAVIKAISW